jgi:hypothetical protein
VISGNLALSRALGDFVFKKNDKKGPDEQIVTGKQTLLKCSHSDNSTIYYSLILCCTLKELTSNRNIFVSLS